MPKEDDRPLAMLSSRDERIQSYLRTTRSTDDIVREVTAGFASDVARIMAKTDDRGSRTDRQQPASAGGNRRG